MAVWPVTLPTQVSWTGYQGAPRDNRIRTQMEAGPPKMRRRFRAGIETITCGQTALTKAQITTLQGFYETTLQGGTLPFDWVHPLTQAATSFRFAVPPSWQGRGPDAFDATYGLEILP